MNFMGFTIFHKHIPSGSWPMARRRPICLHILAGGVQWGGVGLIMSCALRSHTHATLDTFSCNSTDTPQVDNFTSVCPVRWKNVSNVAGTQMLERSWQNLKGFLSKPMCLKYKDKGHSKMHPSVPEYILYVYIYIYMVLETKSWNNTPKKFPAKPKNCCDPRHGEKSMRNRISCVKSQNAEN